MSRTRHGLLGLFVLWTAFRALADDIALVGVGETWRYWYAIAEPPAHWSAPQYSDAEWFQGDSGFGRSTWGENNLLTGLERGSGSVYFRKEFTVADPTAVGSLTLRVDWQGGFVAYLNGREVVRRNVAGPPGSRVPFDTEAGPRYAGVAEDILLTGPEATLLTGRNVLAIQVHPIQGSPVEVVLVPELLANFTRGPYLQSVLSDQARVLWRTPLPQTGVVEWGTQPDLSDARRMPAPGIGNAQEVHLTGLTPGTRHYYRVRVEDQVSPVFSFRTLPAQGDLDFVVLGDSGAGSSAQFDVARGLTRRAPDLAIHLGDIVYPHFTFGQTDTRCLSVYRQLFRTTPFYFTWGNHDLYAGVEPFNAAFRQPTNNTPLSDHLAEGTRPEFYYSFDAGDAHFAVLFWPYSSQYYMREGCPQLRWLEADLAASTKPWKFLCLHHPVNTSGGHRNDDYNFNRIPDRAEVAARLLPVAARSGVQLIFSGHDHNFERFHPIQQTHTVVTGGGGIILYGLVQLDPNSAAFQIRWHHSEVQIRQDQLRLVAVDRAGEAFDVLEFRRTPPTSDDPDGDGLGPAAEAAAGTRPDSPDTDGDGRPDGWEYLRWASPTNSDLTLNSSHLLELLSVPLPRPALQLNSRLAADGHLELRWLGQVGHWAILESAASPDAAWTQLPGIQAGGPLRQDPQQLRVPPTDAPRFFRLRLVPHPN